MSKKSNKPDSDPKRKKKRDFLLFSMRMFTILVTEMKQGSLNCVWQRDFCASFLRVKMSYCHVIDRP